MIWGGKPTIFGNTYIFLFFGNLRFLSGVGCLTSITLKRFICRSAFAGLDQGDGASTATCGLQKTGDGNQKSGKLTRLVVEIPIIYKVFRIHPNGGWEGDFWIIKSMSDQNHPTFMLQGTNMFFTKALLKMIFLFPRWDMLIPRREGILQGTNILSRWFYFSQGGIW